MKGSDKQIEWAKNIVGGWCKQIDDLVEEARARVEDRKNMPQVWLDIAKRVAENAKSKINNADDAAIIIRDRKMGVSRMVFKMMSDEYEKIAK